MGYYPRVPITQQLMAEGRLVCFWFLQSILSSTANATFCFVDINCLLAASSILLLLIAWHMPTALCLFPDP